MNTYKVNGLPWSNGIGTDVKGCNTSQEVMTKAALDFNVDKCSIMANMPINLFNSENVVMDNDREFIRNGYLYKPVSDNYVTYRTDNYVPLGLVKSKYEVVQNTDAFSFFDEAIGIDNCHWQYAGAFGYGEKIFVVAKLGMTSEIKVNNFTDNIENYLVFVNTHDGSGSLTVMFTPVRFFCLNCLQTGISKSEGYLKLRHTATISNRLYQGSQVLKIAYERAESTKDLYKTLGKITLKDDAVMEYIANLILTPQEKMALLRYDLKDGYKKVITRDYACLEATEISMRKANIIANMYDYYFNGIEQKPIIGTAWGAYNAVTGYYSNVANLEGEKRMDSLLFGNANIIGQNALTNTRYLKVA